MNADDLIIELREALDEPNTKKNYYTNDNLLVMLNNAYYDLNRKVRFNRRITNYVNFAGSVTNDVPSIANKQHHKLPSSLVMIDPENRVGWDDGATNGATLTGKSMAHLKESGLFGAVNIAGTPEYYVLDEFNSDFLDDAGITGGTIIQAYPYPSAVGNKLHVPFIARPTALASKLTETSPAATATSPIFKDEFHYLLVWMVAGPKLLKRRRNEDAKLLSDFVGSGLFSPQELYAEMLHYYRGNKNIGEQKKMRLATSAFSEVRQKAYPAP